MLAIETVLEETYDCLQEASGLLGHRQVPVKQALHLVYAAEYRLRFMRQVIADHESRCNGYGTLRLWDGAP